MREPEPVHVGTSETARQARVALENLSPEEWVRDWGAVLCAALDETEHSRATVATQAASAIDGVIAGIEAVRAVTEACTSWMIRTSWSAGKAVLEPTRERQAAAEDLVRLLLEVSATFRLRTDALLAAAGAPNTLDSRAAAVRGDPAARSRASAILDELSREFPAELPLGQHIRGAIQRLRADFLGGSNVPGKDDDDEVPS